MVTKTKKLKTGTPVWTEYPTPQIPVENISKNIATDILIIGCGISGAMMAEALSGKGFDIIVADKRKPISGSTSATTALIQYELDIPLIKLIDKIGYSNAATAWRRSKLALENIDAKIQELKIKCDNERRSSLYTSGNILDPKNLNEECIKRNSIGLAGKILSAKEIKAEYGVKAESAIISYNNIACNPVQLTAGFLKSAMERGCRIFSPVEIEELKKHKDHIIASTNNGFTIKAKNIIFTTGYEIPKYIKTKNHKVHSTWVLSTKPINNKELKDFPFIWQASDPYLYMRTTKDGRIICGGEDEEFTDTDKRDALIEKKIAIIEKKLRKLIPDFSFEIEHTWAGSFGGSKTGLPSIGQIPGMKNVYSVMAYGGNGITFSRIAAEIISSKILKHRDPDEELFAFH